MQVRIRNFQSLKDVEIEVEGLTVLVGPSNIGKSAVVRAVSSALYGRPGDYFVRRGEEETVVSIYGAPSIEGGTFDVEWHKGKGINYFVIDGEKYDKIARDVPVHLPRAGYHEIQVGDEWINPQVADQHDRVFLLDRSGSFVHDVVAQASRLSVLLRADKNCAADLKRQKSVHKIRVGDLELAQAKLEAMKPILELFSRVQVIKPKVVEAKKLFNRLEDLREMSLQRSAILKVKDVKLPTQVVFPQDLGKRLVEVRSLAKERPFYHDLPQTLPERVALPADIGLRLLEVRRLAAERKHYLGLPVNVPSAKPYDFDGMVDHSNTLKEATNLAVRRKVVFRESIEAQAAMKSISQELEIAEAELHSKLDELQVCPVCDRPMKEVATANA